MNSRFLDFTNGKIVTGSGSRSPSDHVDRLLETQNDHYQQLSELPEEDVLAYIDNMLMEEDIHDEDTLHALQESSEFQEKERSFYELLGHKYPPSPHQESTTPLNECEVATLNFWKGVDEASKFLPSTPLCWSTEAGPSKKRSSRRRRHLSDIEEFDTWTRTDGGSHDEVFEAHVADMRNAAASSDNVQSQKRSTGIIKEAADVRSILILCAQIVASDDHRAANELLNQIRTYASIDGNMNQRVAHYFVLGLEARLAGTGGCNNPDAAYTLDTMSPSDYLLAYCTSFISTSFRKIMIFASSKLIAEKSKKSKSVHIVDFGILYGLQWPAFIQRLSEREGGPPTKLRITGIDFPHPECDLTERVDATGSRLAHYAEMFGVPFEYNGIVKSWESIRLKDLKIEEGEFVAVNCLLRAENLQDEMIDGGESPREIVVELIRKMNPDVFFHGVVSSGYGSPYFVSRFRETLFHFSSLFDMIEVVIPKERPERMVLQRILGDIIVNVISCEGPERVSRPETHKQWQIRHTRAGFKQVRFGRKLVGAIQKKVRDCYHREFVTTEDHKWLLMSWKGRTICGLSCWEPVSKIRGESIGYDSVFRRIGLSPSCR